MMRHKSGPVKDEAVANCGLDGHLSEIRSTCIECRKCTTECAFLARYGTPKAIAEVVDPSDPDFLRMAYECSLCGLCGAVCPVGLTPDAFFLEMRRAAVAAGCAPGRLNRMLNYERRGTSARYTWYSLPENCDTVFFPGCTLPGTRPGRTLALYQHLKSHVPDIGIVLDCCGKPSHDLGRSQWFSDMLSEMKRFLTEHGIKKVIAACPNCYRVFRDHGAPLEAVMVYETLLESGLPGSKSINPIGTVTVHDPCVLRGDAHIHDAVRGLADKMGFRIEEMPHCREKTLCCGEGGAVACVDAGLSGAWRARRQHEARGRPILTCCAGCAHMLKGASPVAHIVDALFDPDGIATGRTGAARAPMTYLNRLWLKRRLKKTEPAAVTRERHYRCPADPFRSRMLSARCR